ncbi:MAG TPA: MFS transporter [Rubrobacteraceae bacterium]|nr:MFS transporter [Rubrobacteraceae bacterium]
MRRDGLQGVGTLSFGVLLVSQLAATTGFMFVIPFLPLYVQRLGVEDAGHAAAWAGLLNTATAVTMALAAPLWGKLGDRYGQKKMLLRATLAGSLMLGLMGLVTSPWQLLLLRLLQGSLTGTVAAATVLVSATAPPEKASSRLGALQTFIFCASAAGPFAGGVFADLVGIRASFGVTAALLAASGLMVLFGVRGDEPFGSDAGEDGVSGDGTLPGWRLFPGVLALFVVHLSITAVHPVLPGFLETIMEEPVRVASLAGQILGAGALAAALGSLVGGHVAVRAGVWATVVGALSVAGLASLPQAAVSSVAELFVLRLVADFALGMVIPVANLAVRSAVPPERQGAAFGVAASATSAAFGLGPLGGGLLAASFGFGVPFLVPGVLLLAASAALLVFSAVDLPRYLRLLRLVLANLIS